MPQVIKRQEVEGYQIFLINDDQEFLASKRIPTLGEAKTEVRAITDLVQSHIEWNYLDEPPSDVYESDYIYCDDIAGTTSIRVSESVFEVDMLDPYED